MLLGLVARRTIVQRGADRDEDVDKYLEISSLFFFLNSSTRNLMHTDTKFNFLLKNKNKKFNNTTSPTPPQ